MILTPADHIQPCAPLFDSNIFPENIVTPQNKSEDIPVQIGRDEGFH